ncbi:hypothetical protein Lal_00046458 [Lupinus albus]|nr:hypothetical protein Lal_00046458 [Lupinus albus]
MPWTPSPGGMSATSPSATPPIAAWSAGGVTPSTLSARRPWRRAPNAPFRFPSRHPRIRPPRRRLGEFSRDPRAGRVAQPAALGAAPAQRPRRGNGVPAGTGARQAGAADLPHHRLGGLPHGLRRVRRDAGSGTRPRPRPGDHGTGRAARREGPRPRCVPLGGGCAGLDRAGLRLAGTAVAPISNPPAATRERCHEDLSTLHRRRVRRSGRGRVVRLGRSLSRRALGQDPARLQGRCRPGGGGGQARHERGALVDDDRLGTGQGAAPDRRPRGARGEAPRGNRDPRQRQALRGDVRPDSLPAGMVALFRRPRGQDRGHAGADRQARDLRLHHPRARGRGRRAHRLELAAPLRSLEMRARPRGRLRRGHQAVRICLGEHARIRRPAQGGGPAGRNAERRHRLRRRDRRGHRGTPGRRQDHLHRLGRDRGTNLFGRRQAGEARGSRTRR